MPVVDVLNLEGKKVGQVELADSVFAAEINKLLLHEASRWYLAGLRRGTHKTKEKSEVSGAGRKLWRQKGTGRARIGSIRSPLWRHGGTVHGPKPRTYEYALPKKMVRGALRSALDKLNAETTALLVAAGDNRNLQLASRNLAGVKLAASNALQPYDVLRHDRLVVSKDAAARLVRALDPDRQAVEAPQVESIAPAPAGKKEAAPKAAKSPARKPAAAKKPAAKKGKE